MSDINKEMDFPRRYPYQAKWSNMFWIGLFFVLVVTSVLERVFRFNRAASFRSVESFTGTLFGWTIAGIITMSGFYLLLLSIRRLIRPVMLELTKDAILIPYGFLQLRTRRIAYVDIHRLWESPLAFHMATAKGNSSVAKLLLADRYNVVKELISGRVQCARAGLIENAAPALMTRDEFLARQTAAEADIKSHAFPVRILLFPMVFLMLLICWLLLLLVVYLPLSDYPPEARSIVLWTLGACVCALGVARLAYQHGIRAYKKYGFQCPSCGAHLTFVRDKSMAETGKCGRCGVRIFDGEDTCLGD